MIKKILFTLEEAEEFFKDFNTKEFSWDTETTSLRYTEIEITGISFCNDDKACYIPIDSSKNTKRVKVLTVDEILPFLKEKVFNAKEKGKDTLQACHNIVFDMSVLWKYGIDLTRASWFDTLVAVHLINENIPDKGLKALTRSILKKDVVNYKDASENDDHYTPKFYQYGLDDAINTWELYKLCKQKLTEKGLDILFYRIEMPFQRCLLEMKVTGVLIDRKLVDEITDKLKVEIFNMEKEMYKLLDEPYSIQHTLLFQDMQIKGKLNFGSPKQLSDILFNKLGLEILEYTPTGQPKTGKVTLEAYASKVPFVEKLEQYKIATKLLNAFFEPMPKFIEIDDRVRPSFNDTGTKTGRLSSATPNCFSGDTEVLTLNGWIRLDKYNFGDEIATFSKESNTISFDKPYGDFIKGTTDLMYNFKNLHIDILCTKNHRHLLYDKDRNRTFVRTSDTFSSNALMRNAGKYILKDEEDVNIQKLICAIQADGSFCYRSTYISLDFSFTKERKYKRLVDILNSCNIIFNDYSNENRYRIYFRISNKIKELIIKYLDLNTKTFNPTILQKFGDTFFNELKYWDGLSTRDWGEIYCSTNESNVDLIHAFCSLRGYRSLKSKDNYRISVTNTEFSHTDNIVITKLKGKFKYYCISVPSGIIVTRRNKCVTINYQCQQLPKSNKKFPINTRSCFTVPKGYKMISTDYSGQEIRAMAQITRDPNVIDALVKGYDLHLATAKNSFNLDIPDEALSEDHKDYEEYKKKYKLERQNAKAVSFGLLYGIGPQKLSKQIGCTEKEAKEMIEKYFNGYPMVKKAIDDTHSQVKEKGYVRNLVGRYRRFKKVEGEDYYPSGAFRQSFNFCIQGASADMIRMAANKCYIVSKKNPEWDLKMIMTVHDEIVFQVKEEYVEVAALAIKEAFETVMKFVVPIPADVEWGNNYGEAK